MTNIFEAVMVNSPDVSVGYFANGWNHFACFDLPNKIIFSGSDRFAWGWGLFFFEGRSLGGFSTGF
jgi:hypothetical protein